MKLTESPPPKPHAAGFGGAAVTAPLFDGLLTKSRIDTARRAVVQSRGRDGGGGAGCKAGGGDRTLCVGGAGARLLLGALLLGALLLGALLPLLFL